MFNQSPKQLERHYLKSIKLFVNIIAEYESGTNLLVS